MVKGGIQWVADETIQCASGLEEGSKFLEWTITYIPLKEFLRRIEVFLKHPSNMELFYVASISSDVNSLTNIERSTLWRFIGDIIDLALKRGLKVLGYGIEADKNIFLVLSK